MRAWSFLVCLALVLLWSATAIAAPEIDANALEQLRVAGTTEIVPDARTLASLDVDDDPWVAQVRVCIGRKGKVSSVKVLASSGSARYDKQIARVVKKTWRFSPYKPKKKAIAVCARVELVYQMDGGVEGGVEGGVVGGVVGGVEDGMEGAPPPPPPPPNPTQNVAPTALEAQRISGDKNIVPDDKTKVEIQRAGKTRLVVAVKLCIAKTGTVKSVRILKGSGFPDYDAKLEATIATWVYKPFEVDGVAVDVCSAITFIYVQKSDDDDAP